MLFNYPNTALADRNIAKTRIYQHQAVNTEVKNLFSKQVEKITWAYKLADSTLNIPTGGPLSELQIFHITLKLDTLDDRVLSTIDKAIPSPIIFELYSLDSVQIAAAFKSYGEGEKNIGGRYFFSPWYPQGTPRQPLPFSNTIEALYNQLVSPLLPYEIKEGGNLSEQIQRIEQIERLERDIKRCKSRLRKEKQINKQAPINRELRELRKELELLLHSA